AGQPSDPAGGLLSTASLPVGRLEDVLMRRAGPLGMGGMGAAGGPEEAGGGGVLGEGQGHQGGSNMAGVVAAAAARAGYGSESQIPRVSGLGLGLGVGLGLELGRDERRGMRLGSAGDVEAAQRHRQLVQQRQQQQLLMSLQQQQLQQLQQQQQQQHQLQQLQHLQQLHQQQQQLQLQPYQLQQGVGYRRMQTQQQQQHGPSLLFPQLPQQQPQGFLPLPGMFGPSQESPQAQGLVQGAWPPSANLQHMAATGMYLGNPMGREQPHLLPRQPLYHIQEHPTPHLHHHHLHHHHQQSPQQQPQAMDFQLQADEHIVTLAGSIGATSMEGLYGSLSPHGMAGGFGEGAHLGPGLQLSHLALKLSHARPEDLPGDLQERLGGMLGRAGASGLPPTIRQGCVEVLVEVLHSCSQSTLRNELFGLGGLLAEMGATASTGAGAGAVGSAGGGPDALDEVPEAADGVQLAAASAAAAARERLRGLVGKETFDGCERVT
ncbi:hypothetical protein Agub_g11288, partial [Astrephomene gubernaculifera]